jgi:pyruvate dehydrogenase phosphatase
MRRAAVQVLRSARRPAARRNLRLRLGVGISTTSAGSTSPAANHALGVRSLITARKDRSFNPTIQLASSMQFRKVSVALFSGAVASGAYYMYNGNSSPKDNNPLTSAQAAAYSTAATAAAAADPTRKALVVEQGQIYTGTITGDGPLAKDTDDYGRKVLEMLTPDQATAKLRKNEESWMVNRGTGVVRYDVVQIPSNDPIEDDHAEKIIDVTNVAPTEGSNASDWMFWGVFDGHRYEKCYCIALKLC